MVDPPTALGDNGRMILIEVMRGRESVPIRMVNLPPPRHLKASGFVVKTTGDLMVPGKKQAD